MTQIEMRTSVALHSPRNAHNASLEAKHGTNMALLLGMAWLEQRVAQGHPRQ
jgi:hypothetical protein